MTGRPNPLAAGDVFERLTVINPTPRGAVLCRCSCGREKTTRARNLYAGLVRSCGCLRNEPRSHGRAYSTSTGTHTDYRYRLWKNIKAKCLRPTAPNYRYYGARGITMCESWRDDFTAFATWLDAHLGPRPEGMTLDRIDNDGNYEPGNLRWATRAQQLANRRPPEEWGDRG